MCSLHPAEDSQSNLITLFLLTRGFIRACLRYPPLLDLVYHYVTALARAGTSYTSLQYTRRRVDQEPRKVGFEAYLGIS
jgi:hypothetical protein